MGKESDRVRYAAAQPRDLREDVQRAGWREAERARRDDGKGAGWDDGKRAGWDDGKRAGGRDGKHARRRDVDQASEREVDRASERASHEEAERAFKENLDRSARATRASQDDGHRAKSVRDLKQLESEIKRTRRRLDEYVDELDRRRHRLLAVREHPWTAAGVGLGAIALVAGTVVLLRRRAATRKRVQSRSQNLREALGRMLHHPERVASDGKSPWSRILVAVAPIVVKKVADAALKSRKTRA